MRANIPKGMGGGPQSMQAIARQAQKMQEDMAEKQAELDARTCEVQAGGGAVTVTINGKKEVLSIDIKPEIVDRRISKHCPTFWSPASMRQSSVWKTPTPPKWKRSPAVWQCPDCSDPGRILYGSLYRITPEPGRPIHEAERRRAEILPAHGVFGAGYVGRGSRRFCAGVWQNR